MSDRVRYRDFYDFGMIMKKLSINLDEVISLVKKKEIRSPISKKKILENFDLAKQEKQNDVSSIYYSEEIKNEEIEKELLKLSFDIIEK